MFPELNLLFWQCYVLSCSNQIDHEIALKNIKNITELEDKLAKSEEKGQRTRGGPEKSQKGSH